MERMLIWSRSGQDPASEAKHFRPAIKGSVALTNCSACVPLLINFSCLQRRENIYWDDQLSELRPRPLHCIHGP